jgi:hypothetical protein
MHIAKRFKFKLQHQLGKAPYQEHESLFNVTFFHDPAHVVNNVHAATM